MKYSVIVVPRLQTNTDANYRIKTEVINQSTGINVYFYYLSFPYFIKDRLRDAFNRIKKDYGLVFDKLAKE